VCAFFARRFPLSLPALPSPVPPVPSSSTSVAFFHVSFLLAARPPALFAHIKWVELFQGEGGRGNGILSVRGTTPVLSVLEGGACAGIGVARYFTALKSVLRMAFDSRSLLLGPLCRHARPFVISLHVVFLNSRACNTTRSVTERRTKCRIGCSLCGWESVGGVAAALFGEVREEHSNSARAAQRRVRGLQEARAALGQTTGAPLHTILSCAKPGGEEGGEESERASQRPPPSNTNGHHSRAPTA